MRNIKISFIFCIVDLSFSYFFWVHFPVIPSILWLKRHTILCVNVQTKAKIKACVAAVTILLALGGKYTKTPGVNTKKSKKM